MDAWISKVWSPDYEMFMYYDYNSNEWVINLAGLKVNDIFAAGETLIWSWELNNDFSSSPALEPRVVMFDLNNLDLMRETILSHSGDNALNISNLDISPYNYVVGTNSGKSFRKQKPVVDTVLEMMDTYKERSQLLESVAEEALTASPDLLRWLTEELTEDPDYYLNDTIS